MQQNERHIKSIQSEKRKKSNKERLHKDVCSELVFSSLKSRSHNFFQGEQLDILLIKHKDIR